MYSGPCFSTRPDEVSHFYIYLRSVAVKPLPLKPISDQFCLTVVCCTHWYNWSHGLTRKAYQHHKYSLLVVYITLMENNYHYTSDIMQDFYTKVLKSCIYNSNVWVKSHAGTPYKLCNVLACAGMFTIHLVYMSIHQLL